MNKKNITLMVVAVLTLITFVGLATYAYFVGNINTTRTSNVTATTERNNLVFDTNGGAMQLNVSAANMQRARNGTVAAQNSTTLTVNLTANTNYSMVCTYDIVYEWTSSDKYTSHSSGVSSNEFTIKASLASNSNTYEGTNNIVNETDLSSLSYTNNSATVISGAQIDATGSTMSTAVWTLESKIYNVNANQTSLVNKNFGGRFKIANVSCVAGTAESSTQTLADFIINSAPKSGTDNVTNSPWILTSDRTGEYRYAGKNPDNYISFNGELWRIIGVMPNMEYCTGTYTDSTCTATENGSLVKIIKNDSLGSMSWDNGTSSYAYNPLYNRGDMTLLKSVGDSSIAVPYICSGKNNWYNSSLKNVINQNYTSSNSIAVANWKLYGFNDDVYTGISKSAYDMFEIERNNNNLGGVANGNPTYWYGKIGLMYPSDYGYATNGDNQNNRTTCLNTAMGNWMATQCGGSSWLAYIGITNSPINTTSSEWFLSPNPQSDDAGYYRYAYGVWETHTINAQCVSTNYEVRPVLYLKPNINIKSGHGTWNDPYAIE